MANVEPKQVWAGFAGITEPSAWPQNWVVGQPDPTSSYSTKQDPCQIGCVRVSRLALEGMCHPELKAEGLHCLQKRDPEERSDEG